MTQRDTLNIIYVVDSFSFLLPFPSLLVLVCLFSYMSIPRYVILWQPIPICDFDNVDWNVDLETLLQQLKVARPRTSTMYERTDRPTDTHNLL